MRWPFAPCMCMAASRGATQRSNQPEATRRILDPAGTVRTNKRLGGGGKKKNEKRQEKGKGRIYTDSLDVAMLEYAQAGPPGSGSSIRLNSKVVSSDSNVHEWKGGWALFVCRLLSSLTSLPAAAPCRLPPAFSSSPPPAASSPAPVVASRVAFVAAVRRSTPPSWRQAPADH